jgi:hypothetical protein
VTAPALETQLGSGVVLGWNSERTEQNSADERKHGAHRQNIEPQGKVHVISPIAVDETKV